MGLGIVFRSMEPGQYLRLQGISILWMRREKSQSSRKRWTDHLGDLPTFRKPFEKAAEERPSKQDETRDYDVEKGMASAAQERKGFEQKSKSLTFFSFQDYFFSATETTETEL